MIDNSLSLLASFWAFSCDHSEFGASARIPISAVRGNVVAQEPRIALPHTRAFRLLILAPYPVCVARSGWVKFRLFAGALPPAAAQVKRVLLTAFREDQGDVVVLLLRAEAEDFVDHGGERGL